MSLSELKQNFGPIKSVNQEEQILKDLENRLKIRGTDIAEEIKKSLADANDLNDMLG
jgi:guanylate kinase